MDFFDKVLGEEEGWLPLMRLSAENKLNIAKWFHWPEQKFQIAQYIDQYSGEDVYFSPMLYSEPTDKNDPTHTAKKNVVSCRVAWADADTAAPEVFKAQPTISVETSEGRWHTYWVLEDTTDPKVCESLSHSIADAHRNDGVDRGWALSKRLRVPGTFNTKGGGMFMVSERSQGPTYTLGELAADYEPIESVEVSSADIPSGLNDPEHLLTEVPFNALIQKLYYEDPIQDYSTALHTLEMLLFESGCDAERVFGIVRGAACNKFNRPGRTEEELWRHVLSAEAKHKENVAVSSAPKETLPEPEKQLSAEEEKDEEVFVQHDWSNLELLTKQERQSLSRTFIDDYADWGKSKSARSARQYHEAAAWTLLSTVFSEFAHVVPAYGDTPLNLYFLVLGSTTRSRKSTAKNMMMRFIDDLTSEDQDYDYDLGSDATPEALVEVLSERPGRSSLFWRDEVQAMFAHHASGGYLAGLLSLLTEAYDGYVRGTLRKTGAKKRTKKTKTSLVFYGIGIITQVAETLHDDDFFSGFLPRVLWVLDLEGDKSYGSTDVVQQDLNDKGRQADAAYDAMLRRLTEARTFWQRWKNRAGAPMASYGMPAEDAAWQRWQEMTVELEKLADRHPTRAEVLAPGAQRLGVATLKAAALLAILDQKNEISLDHMLSAIRFTNEWAKYMEYMARQVSKSRLHKNAETLLELISSSTKPVPYGKGLAQFKGEMNVREYNELLEYMQAVGMIFIDQKGSKKALIAR